MCEKQTTTKKCKCSTKGLPTKFYVDFEKSPQNRSLSYLFRGPPWPSG